MVERLDDVERVETSRPADQHEMGCLRSKSQADRHKAARACYAELLPEGHDAHPTKTLSTAMRRFASFSVTKSSFVVVTAAAALLLISCAAPTAEAKLPKNGDRNVLCEACNATLMELQAMVKKTEKKFGRGTSVSAARALDEVPPCDARGARASYPSF